VLLLAPLAIQALVLRYTSVLRLIRVCILSGLLSIGACCPSCTDRSIIVQPLALTVAVDSYLWNQWPVWPELYGVYFNVYHGKSSEWGVSYCFLVHVRFSPDVQTSPAYTYFLSHLPKLLLGSLPLALLGAVLDDRIRALIIPPVMFIGLISGLGHKEWRFIIYVVPLFDIAAARGARWM